MAAPARFLFDNDFAAPVARGAVPVVPMIELSEHEALLQDAVDAARAEGYAAGRDSAEAMAAERLAAEAARVAAAVEDILARLDSERHRIEGEAIRLAAIIGKQLAGSLIERFTQERVLEVVSEAVEPLRHAPHLVVRLAEADAEALRDRLAQAVTRQGFEGRLVVMGEPDIAGGDCSIQWADGGVTLDRAAIAAKIDRAVTLHLNAPKSDPLETET